MSKLPPNCTEDKIIIINDSTSKSSSLTSPKRGSSPIDDKKEKSYDITNNMFSEG